MNPAEAVQAFCDCGAEFALGHHYGTFQLTDEAIDAPLSGSRGGAERSRNSAGALSHFAAGRDVAALA